MTMLTTMRIIMATIKTRKLAMRNPDQDLISLDQPRQAVHPHPRLSSGMVQILPKRRIGPSRSQIYGIGTDRVVHTTGWRRCLEMFPQFPQATATWRSQEETSPPRCVPVHRRPRV
jgi:hypothetical protein